GLDPSGRFFVQAYGSTEMDASLLQIALTGFLPASEWRSPADTSTAPLPKGTYCRIPMDASNVVRGARNNPCVDVPGKRAATPRECRSNEAY
ncbi:hypothetical protein LNK15_13025, partial [Jeotgalicoccus huakuii]|nr:hypothetical protein [Jeotgalicoccus huakuii]